MDMKVEMAYNLHPSLAHYNQKKIITPMEFPLEHHLPGLQSASKVVSKSPVAKFVISRLRNNREYSSQVSPTAAKEKHDSNNKYV